MIYYILRLQSKGDIDWNLYTVPIKDAYHGYID